MKKVVLPLSVFLALLALPALLWAAPAAPAKSATNEFHAFFIAGGWLVWFILLPLSLVTVSLIIQYLLAIRRKKILPAGVIPTVQKMLQSARHQAALDYLREEGSFLSRTLHAGLAQSPPSRAAMENAMAEVLEQDTTDLFRRIEWLNVIGNVAPMIGLFGTVWGMIESFNAIVRAGGQPEPADLAGGISVALVTTWWGLVIAIPALAAYGALRNRIDSLSAETAVTAEKVIASVASSPFTPADKHRALQDTQV